MSTKKLRKNSPEWLKLLKYAVVVARPFLVRCRVCGKPTEWGHPCAHCDAEVIGCEMIDPNDYDWKVTVKK